MPELFKIEIRDWNHALVAGLGNCIKSDDGAGIYIAQKLKEKGVLNVIVAENGIENYIGKINRFMPETLIMIDALDFGNDCKAGFFDLIPLHQVKNTTTSTHNCSLKTISSLLEVPHQWVLGIQPGSVSFGTELTPAVHSAAGQIIEIIYKVYAASVNRSAFIFEKNWDSK